MIEKEKKEWFFAVQFVLWLCAGFSILVLGFYVISKGWNEAAYWGAFGDFVGGLLNPFFAFANLILLVTISYQLKARDEAQSEADRVAQREQSAFEVSYGLKSEAVKELVKILNNVPSPLRADTNYDTAIVQSALDFSDLFESQFHLFPTMEKGYNEMNLAFQRLYMIANSFKDLSDNGDQMDLEEKLRQDLTFCFYKDFLPVRQLFTKELRATLIR